MLAMFKFKVEPGNYGCIGTSFLKFMFIFESVFIF